MTLFSYPKVVAICREIVMFLHTGISACSAHKIMFILTEAVGKPQNTLILLPSHSSAKDFDKSDNTPSSKNAEIFLKISKICSPLFTPVYLFVLLRERSFEGCALCTRGAGVHIGEDSSVR